MKTKEKYIHSGFTTEPVSFQEYENRFFDPTYTIPVDRTVNKDALDRAWKNRDFEIDLYWKRATYFWTFIAATLVGYFSLYSSNIIKEFHQIEFILICLGFFLSVIWVLANKASKFWIENWEYHIDMLEDFSTGPLYKTVKINPKYSVTRLNSLINFFMVVIWISLGIHYSVKYNLWEMPTPFIWYKNLDWYSLTSFLFTIILTVKAFFTKSRRRDSEKTGFTFRKRIFEK